MVDPLRAPFLGGASHRRGRSGSGATFALLVTAAAGCAVLAVTLAPLQWGGAHLAEAPVPEGSWLLDWGRGVLPPSAEQAAQLRGLRAAAAGTAGLVALLALLSLLGLWLQRLRLRRHEDRVHWALGARRLQLVARVVGERWRWGVAGVAASVFLAAGLPVALTRSFPGEAIVPPPVGALLILGTALGVLLLRGESRAGEAAARPRVHPFRRLAASPGLVAAVGFAVLSGVSLLSRHGPLGGNAPTPEGTRVAAVDFAGIPAPDRAVVVVAWLEALRPRGLALGVASAGAARGTGHRARVWVDCGRCSEGGLPLPVRTVQAEVHAVAPDTFADLGIEVVQGRDFDRRESRGPLSGAIVSSSLAARHFESGAAVGRRIRFGDGDWVTVVGIVSDRADAGDHTAYAVYLPVAQALPAALELLASSPDALEAGLATLPPGAAGSAPLPMDRVFAVHGWFTTVLRALGLLALVLVAFGVWLGARNEARATLFEVSVRRAVGARRRHLVAAFARRSVLHLALVLTGGTWISLFLSAGLDRAYGAIPPLDPRVLLWAGLPVAAAFLLGSLPPFLAALRTPPAVGLESGE